MPRRLRIEMPGGVYHVTNRGVDRTNIVRDDTDLISRRALAPVRTAQTGASAQRLMSSTQIF